MASVTNSNEILLNSVRFPLSTPVRRTLANIYAPKITIGDVTRDSEQRASSVAFNDYRGGIGWHTGLDSTTADRSWYSTCQTRYAGHLLLPRKTTSIDSPGSSKITTIQTYNNQIYVTAQSNIYALNGDLSSWSSSKQNMSADATDSIVAQVEKKPYLLYATNSAQGLWYSSDGASFTQVTTSTLDLEGGHLVPKFFTYWQDKIWMLAVPSGSGVATQQARLYRYDTTHQSTINFQVWQPDALVPLEVGDVTAVFLGRDITNKPIIYINTTKGLYVHDSENERIIETEVGLPFQPDAGKGSVKWRDAIYFGVGTGVYKYQVGDPSTLSVVGPDRDHGLPSNYSGNITDMVGSHNDLLIALDGTTGTEGSTLFSGSGNVGSQVHGGSTVIEQSGQSSILGWNERGWEFKWSGTAAAENIVNMHVSNSPIEATDTDSSYRLWWSSSSKFYRQNLERNIVNPDQISTFSYETNTSSEISAGTYAGIHETPWFDADDTINAKLALSMVIEARNVSSTKPIKIKYALNHDDTQGTASTFTTLATITSAGVSTNSFANAGVSFNAIKFRFELASEDSNSSPDLVRAEFRFRKKLNVKYGFQAQIDMAFKGKTYKGKTRQQLKDALETAISSNTLLEFRYKPADDGDASTYYTEVVSASGFDMTGRDDRKQITVQLLEP